MSRKALWRQAPVGVYFADFVCKREKLIFEIDGGGHYSDDGAARDARRTAVLEQAGYRVVRFSNDDVLGNADGVGEILVGILGEPGGGMRGRRWTPTSPPPVRGRDTIQFAVGFGV